MANAWEQRKLGDIVERITRENAVKIWDWERKMGKNIVRKLIYLVVLLPSA